MDLSTQITPPPPPPPLALGLSVSCLLGTSENLLCLHLPGGAEGERQQPSEVNVVKICNVIYTTII